MKFDFIKGTDDVSLITQKVDLLQNGKAYTVTIFPRKTKRSLAQNRTLWLWLKCIGENTGNSIQDLHDVYCDKFLCRKIVYNGEQIVASRSTSQLNTQEFADFLTQIHAHALVELGIELPDPDSPLWGHFEEIYG